MSDHRPPHHPLALRGAGAPLALRARDAHLRLGLWPPPGGYVVASGESKAFDDPGLFVGSTPRPTCLHDRKSCSKNSGSTIAGHRRTGPEPAS